MKNRRKISWPLIFIAPFFIVYIVFNLIPIISGVYISLTSWRGFGALKYVGVDNYIRLFSRDPTFLNAILNSVIIMLEGMIPLQVFSLVFASVLNQKLILGGKSFIRNAFFLPYITTPVAIGLIFSVLLDQHTGIANFVLMKIGILGSQFDWLHTASVAKPLVAVMIFWRYFGYVTLFYLAGLQTINKQIYDAATVDGSGRVRTFVSITLPLMQPVIMFQVVMGILGTLRTFEEPLMLFNSYEGGINHAAQTMNMKYFQTAFQQSQFGYGASMGYVMFLMIGAFTLLYFTVVRRFAGTDYAGGSDE
ncbi:MAG TPA: sugar ABC transporter permease [Spirochaetia bacterium]|nr:sugar ABC transporter permease [Spirochaetia bacterium]